MSKCSEEEQETGRVLIFASVSGRRSACLWGRAVSHTISHTAECIQITANPKCHSQIPESSLLAYPLHFSSTSLAPPFNAGFEFLLGTIEAHNVN